MTMNRGLFAGLALAVAGALHGAAIAAEASYPARPITIVVPFGAGTGTDVITRVIAEKMAADMKTTMIIDNKAGASGQIGTELVARAQPDGYTLLVGTNSTHSGNPYLFKSLRYDATKSFEPIGRMTINPLAFLVKQDSPFKAPQHLIDYAHAHPGKLSYGYGNTGGQVSAAMLVNMAKLNVLSVPYKTTPQVFTDLIGGQIDFAFVDLAASQSLMDGGKLRAIAVTSPKRFKQLPHLPATRETRALEDFSLFAWLGLLAPAGTPRPIVAQLNAALRNALDSPEVKRRLEERTGSIVEPTTSEQFAEFMHEQSELWKRRIREAGIQPE